MIPYHGYDPNCLSIRNTEAHQSPLFIKANSAAQFQLLCRKAGERALKVDRERDLRWFLIELP